MSDAPADLLPVALICCGVPLAIPVVAAALATVGRRERARGQALAADLGLAFDEARGVVGEALDEHGGAAPPQAAAAARGFAGFVLGLFSVWRVRGRIDGCEVEIRLVSRGSSKSRTTYTRIEVKLDPPRALGLRISRESLLTGLGKRVGGASEVTLGDPRVDDKAFIVASDAGGAARLLAPAPVRDALVSMLDAVDAIVTDEAVAVELYGKVLDAERLRPILGRMLPLAHALADGR